MHSLHHARLAALQSTSHNLQRGRLHGGVRRVSHDAWLPGRRLRRLLLRCLLLLAVLLLATRLHSLLVLHVLLLLLLCLLLSWMLGMLWVLAHGRLLLSVWRLLHRCLSHVRLLHSLRMLHERTSLLLHHVSLHLCWRVLGHLLRCRHLCVLLGGLPRKRGVRAHTLTSSCSLRCLGVSVRHLPCSLLRLRRLLLSLRLPLCSRMLLLLLLRMLRRHACIHLLLSGAHARRHAVRHCCHARCSRVVSCHPRLRHAGP